MANPIQLKRSKTAGNTPASLADGEVAVNIPDRKLYVNDGTGTIRNVDLTSDIEKIGATQPIGNALAGKYSNLGGAIQAAAAAGATDGALVNMIRLANYSGGQAGYVNFAHRAYTAVGANVQAYEWTGLFVMDNSAAVGEQVALYAQALKKGAGATWGITIEATEPTGTPYQYQLIGCENVITAAGGDSSNNRIVHYAGFKAQPDATSGNMDGYAVYLARGTSTARALYAFSCEHTFRTSMMHAQTSVGVASGAGQTVKWLDFNTTTPNNDVFTVQHTRLSSSGTQDATTVAVQMRRDVDGSQIGVVSFETAATRIYAGSSYIISLSSADGSLTPNNASASDLGNVNTRFRTVYAAQLNGLSNQSAPTGKADTTGSVGEMRFLGGNVVYIKTSGGWGTIPITLMS